jgi:hypothetical protein
MSISVSVLVRAGQPVHSDDGTSEHGLKASGKVRAGVRKVKSEFTLATRPTISLRGERYSPGIPYCLA